MQSIPGIFGIQKRADYLSVTNYLRVTNTENLFYSPLRSLHVKVTRTRENHHKIRESSCIFEDSENRYRMVLFCFGFFYQNLFAYTYVWPISFQIIMEFSPKLFLLQYFYIRVLEKSLSSLPKDIIKSMVMWGFLDF